MNDKLSDILLNINIAFSELFKHNYKITDVIYGFNPWDDFKYCIYVNIYNIKGITSDLVKVFNNINDNYTIYNNSEFFKIVFKIN